MDAVRKLTMNVAFFVYCGVALFVIVNGQSTTDDDIEKDEINRLVDLVAELRAELSEVKGELSAMKSRQNKRMLIAEHCDFTLISV